MLFKNTTEFKIVDKGVTLDTLAIYIAEAEDAYIIPTLGREQYDELNDAYNDTPPLSTELAALLPIAQKALRFLTMYHAIPQINLRFNNNGVTKADSPDYIAAPSGEIFFSRVQFLLDGYAALDRLIKFLNDNQSDYPLWTGSTAFNQYKQFFVNSAEEFQKHTGISNRYVFAQLLPVMDEVEKLYLKEAISEDFYNDLKTKFTDGTLSAEEQTLVSKLLKPLSVYCYAKGLTDPNVREKLRIATATTADDLSNKYSGSNYREEYARLAAERMTAAGALMTQAINYLNTTASDSVFPLYFTSNQYTAPLPEDADKSIEHYRNRESDSIFIMI